MILYRVAEGGPFDLEVDNGVTIENITDDLVNAKILIPDTRLKAIADAWVNVDGSVYDEVRFVAPELFDSLNALPKETDNE